MQKIFPKPQKEVYGEGSHCIKANYICPDEISDVLLTLSFYTEKLYGIKFTRAEGGLYFENDSQLPDGKYIIKIDSSQAKIIYSDKNSAHYAVSSLISLLSSGQGSDSFLCQCEYVEDFPDYEYRGFMLDVARQKHPLDYIIAYIDMCYFYKIKYFQIHFTEDLGFTLPLDCLPKLWDSEKGFTKSDIAAICDYAQQRGIVIIPEVDIPGHTGQFFKNYPEIFGTSGILPACEEVFSYIDKIFAEVYTMFCCPQYIHIGGDEAKIECWENCEKSKAYMAQNGIDNIKALYAHYIKRTTEAVLALGATPIVWEGFSKEYNDMISKKVIVIAWESYYQPAYDLAKSGFKLINCSWKPLYIVTPKAYWSQKEIFSWDAYSWQHWWEKSVAYNGYKIDKSSCVLGGQLCAWSDHLALYDDWKSGISEELCLVAGRLPVLAQRLWNEKCTFDEFKNSFGVVDYNSSFSSSCNPN